MAVVAVKSTSITNRDSGNQSPSYVNAANSRTTTDTVAITNGDSIASVFRVCRIPSNARIKSVSLFCTAITSGAADVGLYQTATYGGAVVDADFFTAAQTIATASGGISVMSGNLLSGANSANRNKRVWEVLGLTSDPGREYDVALTLTAAAAATGTAGLEVEYVL
jgi:hypothetical protein